MDFCRFVTDMQIMSVSTIKGIAVMNVLEMYSLKYLLMFVVDGMFIRAL